MAWTKDVEPTDGEAQAAPAPDPYADLTVEELVQKLGEELDLVRTVAWNADFAPAASVFSALADKLGVGFAPKTETDRNPEATLAAQDVESDIQLDDIPVERVVSENLPEVPAGQAADAEEVESTPAGSAPEPGAEPDLAPAE